MLISATWELIKTCFHASPNMSHLGWRYVITCNNYHLTQRHLQKFTTHQTSSNIIKHQENIYICQKKKSDTSNNHPAPGAGLTPPSRLLGRLPPCVWTKPFMRDPGATKISGTPFISHNKTGRVTTPVGHFKKKLGFQIGWNWSLDGKFLQESKGQKMAFSEWKLLFQESQQDFEGWIVLSTYDLMAAKKRLIAWLCLQCLLYPCYCRCCV